MASLIHTLIEEFDSELSAAKKIWIGPAIPREKALGATAAFAPSVDVSEVVLLQDDTVFGSAKNGIVVTEKEFFLNQQMTEKPFRISLSAIHQATYRKTFWSEKLWLNNQLVAWGDTANLALWFQILEKAADSSEAPKQRRGDNHLESGARERLATLQRLFDDGLLSEEEYTEKRKKIIESI
jgi:hypothetical protein